MHFSTSLSVHLSSFSSMDFSFLYELFHNSSVSIKKVINWFLYSQTNASVYSFASNSNTNVTVRKFHSCKVERVPHSPRLNENKILQLHVCSTRCFLFVIINVKYSQIFVQVDFSSKKSKIYIADTFFRNCRCPLQRGLRLYQNYC